VGQEPSDRLQQVTPYRRIRKLQALIDTDAVHPVGSGVVPDRIIDDGGGPRCDQQPHDESDYEHGAYPASHACPEVPRGHSLIARYSSAAGRHARVVG
jgi:hypothetical protein